MLLFFKMFSTLERSVISKDTSTDACSDRFISAKSPVTRDCVFNTCNILDNISYIQNYLMRGGITFSVFPQYFMSTHRKSRH